MKRLIIIFLVTFFVMFFGTLLLGRAEAISPEGELWEYSLNITPVTIVYAFKDGSTYLEQCNAMNEDCHYYEMPCANIPKYGGVCGIYMPLYAVGGEWFYNPDLPLFPSWAIVQSFFLFKRAVQVAGLGPIPFFIFFKLEKIGTTDEIPEDRFHDDIPYQSVEVPFYPNLLME